MAVHVGRIARATLHRSVTAYGIVEPEPAGRGRVPADAEVASPVAGDRGPRRLRRRPAGGQGRRPLPPGQPRRRTWPARKPRKPWPSPRKISSARKSSCRSRERPRRAYLEAEQQLNAGPERARARPRPTWPCSRIQAPLAGTVVKINSEPGEAVELNTVLAKIIDLGPPGGHGQRPQPGSGRLIKAGQPVRFEDSDGRRARCVYVGAQVDDKTDTVAGAHLAARRPGLPAGAVPERPDRLRGAGRLPGRARGRRDRRHGRRRAPGLIVLVEGDKAVPQAGQARPARSRPGRGRGSRASRKAWSSSPRTPTPSPTAAKIHPQVRSPQSRVKTSDRE